MTDNSCASIHDSSSQRKKKYSIAQANGKKCPNDCCDQPCFEARGMQTHASALRVLHTLGNTPAVGAAATLGLTAEHRQHEWPGEAHGLWWSAAGLKQRAEAGALLHDVCGKGGARREGLRELALRDVRRHHPPRHHLLHPPCLPDHLHGPCLAWPSHVPFFTAVAAAAHGWEAAVIRRAFGVHVHEFQIHVFFYYFWNHGRSPGARNMSPLPKVPQVCSNRPFPRQTLPECVNG